MSEHLPVVASSVEIRTVDEVAAEAAKLWKQQWAKLEDLSVEQLGKAAAIIKRAHPHFTEIDILKYYDFLGGKLRENAEYWMDMASRHPQYERMYQERIKPGSELWDMWLGETDPNAIAAAVLTWVFRKDRGEPQCELNYVKMDDSILYDYTIRNLGGGMAPGEAEAKGRSIATDSMLFHKSFWSAKQKTYFGKFKTLAPDWPALALKKARTTSARRALMRAFSLQESRAASLSGYVDDALSGRDVDLDAIEPIERDADTDRQHRPTLAGQPTKLLSDGETRQEHDDEDNASPFHDRPILEKDRKKMHLWLRDRQIPSGRHLHDELKVIIAEIQGVDFNSVSTKNVTYGQYERIREICEGYPLIESKESGAPDATTIVNPSGSGSDRNGEDDGKAGSTSSASVPSPPTDPNAERRANAEREGRKPCVHNDDPQECSKCAEVEDRRIADEERKAERAGMDPDLFDGPPLDENQAGY